MLHCLKGQLCCGLMVSVFGDVLASTISIAIPCPAFIWVAFTVTLSERADVGVIAEFG
ncbi:hypothetical protein DYY67_2060 [Candidatus Nitrosotalea sp. TS]|nr:hypothetical protein [Candidatus Nitrosotalea sp. TS]